MMRIQPYKSTDFTSLNKWLAGNNHPACLQDELPDHGFIIPGVAIGFLRRCEGKAAIFDSLVTNPRVSSQTRETALNALVAHILHQANNLGFTSVIAITKDETIVTRAIRVGFKRVEYSVLVHSVDPVDLARPVETKESECHS